MADPSDHLQSSPRARLREILDSLYDLDDLDSLSIPRMVDEVTRHVDEDEALRWAIAREVVDTFVREVVSRRVASTRGLLLMGNEVVSRDLFEARVRQRARRFERWMEHAGDRHYQLLTMRKPDLLVAAVERERSGLTELQIAALWRRLAAGLVDDSQAVGDRYTTEEIALLADRLKVSYSVDDTDGPAVVDQPPGGGPPTPPGPTPINRPPTTRVRVPSQPRPRRSQ